MKTIEKILFLSMLTLTLVYFGYKWLPTQFYEANETEKSLLYPAISIFETGNLAFEEITSDTGDYDFQDTTEQSVSPKNGRIYSSQPPLPVLTAIPIYGLWKLVNIVFNQSPEIYPTMIWIRVFFGVIPFLLSILFLFKLLTNFLEVKRAWLVLFLYIFGTMNLSFSFLGYPHILAGLWIILIIYYTTVKQKPFLTGLFSGLLILTDYSMIPAGIIVFIYSMIKTETENKGRNIAQVIAGFMPGIALYLFYHLSLFGNALLPAIYYSTTSETGFLFPLQFSFRQLAEVLIGPSRGILFYTPALIFTGIGTAKLYKENRGLALLIVLTTLLYIFGLSGYPDYAGGWSPGLRYIIPLIPLWMIGIGYALRDMHHWKGVYRYLLYISIFVSVGLNILPKMGHVFYPDNIIHPTYWSGARFIFGYYIDALNWGDWRTFLSWVVYLVLLSGTFLLIFNNRAEIEPKKEGWISAGIALLVTALIVTFPHHIHTYGMQDMYRLSQQYPHIGWFQLQVYSGNEATIRTEFPDNQEPAEILLHNIHAYNIATSSINLTESYMEWTSTELYDEIMYEDSESAKYYKQALAFYDEIWKRLYRYLILKKNEHELDTVQESKWGARYFNYKNLVVTETNPVKLREMYEFLYYGAMMEYEWTNLRAYLSNYMDLYEAK